MTCKIELFREGSPPLGPCVGGVGFKVGKGKWNWNNGRSDDKEDDSVFSG